MQDSQYNRLCPGCFQDKGDRGVCSRCGFDEGMVKRSARALPYRTLLNNNIYLVGRVLGVGGFGITYLGWDIYMHERVAIKEYLPKDLVSRGISRTTVVPESEEDEEQFNYGLKQFLDEARRIRKIDHLNIVKVRAFFEQHGTAYFVMDYYDGLTLEQYREKQGGRLSETLSLDIMIPVLDGLKLVHESGLLHRDIKPQNIYLKTVSPAIPILLDFGSARYAVGEHTRSLTVVVTPGYAPYEQYCSHGQGTWTDIYSIGATLYTLVTGTVPPQATDRKGADTLLPPRSINGDITESLNTVLLQSLAMAPESRYQTVESFRAALIGIRRGEQPVYEPVPVAQVSQPQPKTDSPFVPPSKPSQPRQPFNRKWLYAGIALVLMVCLGILIPFLKTPLHTVSVVSNPAEGGEVKGSGEYRENFEASVTAKANEGFVFKNWTESGNIVSKEPDYTFRVEGDIALVANFEVSQHTVSLRADPASGGSVTGGGKYRYGSSVTVRAAEMDGYTFKGWRSGDSIVSEQMEYTFTVSGDVLLVAGFHGIPEYSITATADPSAGGSVTGGGNFREGRTATLRATARAGYVFKNWTEGGRVLGGDAALTVTANADRVITAHFEAVPEYNITASAAPSGGGSVTGSGKYREGSAATLRATAREGYGFKNWTEGGRSVSSSATFRFTVNSNRNFVANFESIIGSMTDTRDRQTYKTVKIGNQVWMAENLKYLPSVSPSRRGSRTDLYYYVYGYQGTSVSEAKATDNFNTYGVLYNWPAALTACPPGWHLPSDAEWTVLTDYLGGRFDAGGKMKSTGTRLWKSPNRDATNSSGWSGLPGGSRGSLYGSFDNLGSHGYWWSASEDDAEYAWSRYLHYGYGYVFRGSINKASGFSVRCLRDDN